MKRKLRKRTIECPHPRCFHQVREDFMRDHLERKHWRPHSSPTPRTSEAVFTSGYQINPDDLYRRWRRMPGSVFQ